VRQTKPRLNRFLTSAVSVSVLLFAIASPAAAQVCTRKDVSFYSNGNFRVRRVRIESPIDFMHAQAFEVLPPLFAALHVERPWLFGHSDGGSIALLHAGLTSRPLAAGIVMAPHVLVEDVSVRSIEAAKVAYETTDLREKLRRYHDDRSLWAMNVNGGKKDGGRFGRTMRDSIAAQGQIIRRFA